MRTQNGNFTHFIWYFDDAKQNPLQKIADLAARVSFVSAFSSFLLQKGYFWLNQQISIFLRSIEIKHEINSCIGRDLLQLATRLLDTDNVLLNIGKYQFATCKNRGWNLSYMFTESFPMAILISRLKFSEQIKHILIVIRRW